MNHATRLTDYRPMFQVLSKRRLKDTVDLATSEELHLHDSKFSMLSTVGGTSQVAVPHTMYKLNLAKYQSEITNLYKTFS